MSSKRDYYEVLGVGREAGGEELKRAYRALAMQFHPDRNVGDEQASRQFKEAAEAYEVLTDPEKRARYDRYGHAGLEGVAMPDFNNSASMFDILGDLFGGMFGERAGGARGPHAGEDLVYALEISLAEAYHGALKTISYPREECCSECKGTGAKAGTRPVDCRHCGGRGVVVISQGFFRMQQTCRGCGGRGKVVAEVCGTCKGRTRVKIKRTLQVQLPAGVDNGARQIQPLRGEGNAGDPGGPRGDLYIEIRIQEHRFFRREGDHLICQVPISISQAALGGPVEIPTLDGPIVHELLRGHQSHQAIRLNGKGMVNLRSGRRGDLIVVLTVETPTQLTKRQEELLRELAEIDKKHVSPERKSFFETIRGLFSPGADGAAPEAAKEERH
jgi:molecular chaperone DnaJ